MKKAFTLAEVLITLGIIGVVAAITMPMLIGHYQKVVWYNQFKKAVSQLENAFKLYEVDNDCVGNILDCLNCNVNTSHCAFYAKDIRPYFKVAKIINEDNYETVCKKALEQDSDYPCYTDFGGYEYGFITNDGMMINSGIDLISGFGEFVIDINGPNKNPNKYGRDIFVFIQPNSEVNNKMLIPAGSNIEKEYYSGFMSTCDEAGHYYGCAGKLLSEGKMNY